MKIQFKSFAMSKQLVFTLVFAMFLSVVASAQTNKEEMDLYQSIFGMAKKDAVAGFLQLEQNDPFWAVYDQYESERKVLGQKRIAILNDYAENYSKHTDEKTDDLVKQMMTQKKQLDKLITSYYKKVKQTNGSRVAAQFYQLENYILEAIRLAVLESIPFIGEFGD